MQVAELQQPSAASVRRKLAMRQLRNEPCREAEVGQDMRFDWRAQNSLSVGAQNSLSVLWLSAVVL